MLRIAHADAAAVVDRDPGRAARAVEQRVEEGPVGHGIRAVLHRLGLAVGAGHRARIEVVSADDDRRLQLPVSHHLVEGEARAMALAEPEPADSRGQALETDLFPGEVEPAEPGFVLRDRSITPGARRREL